MTLQRQQEFAHAESQCLPTLVEPADVTADLPEDSTADLVQTTDYIRPYASDSAALEEIESTEGTTEDVDTSSQVCANQNAGDEILATNQVATRDLHWAPLPRQRVSGFFLFTACAVVAMFFAGQRKPDSHAIAPPQLARSAPVEATRSIYTRVGIDGSRENAGSTELVRAANAGRDTTNVPLSVVAFALPSFATSERALAAVFIIKRTEGLRSRAVVRWAARSGSADAGIDFSDASGTARFAVGQQQLAIYVPLRNDLLREDDETFKVCLRSVQHARIGGKSCAEATIRDDDDPAQRS